MKVHQRYEWTYLYAFVRPATGEVHWLILPTVSVQTFSMALCHFAKEIGCGKDRHILLVVDKAGWHTGKEVEVPEGIHLEFLPASSPELQPSERLWPLSNEGVANRFFEDLEGLEEAPRGAMRGVVRSAGDHPLLHALPLVAGGGMKSKSIQPDLVSILSS